MDRQFISPLVSGGVAGLTVDLVLFPLDTVKTRLQSSRGFLASGGFKKIYAGILPTAAGSAPSAALFFCTYELTKRTIGSRVPEEYGPFVHMLAAIMGEVVSNIMRVPFEVIKQRSQANIHLTPFKILKNTLNAEGTRGLFRGYFSTIAREIPFSFLQYPIWEHLKWRWRTRQSGILLPWQGAVCGAFAGGFSAAVTTPLDVAKTRIMLARASDSEAKLSLFKVLLNIGKQEGMSGLLAGFVARVSWTSMGGFVFLGAYEKASHTISNFMQ